MNWISYLRNLIVLMLLTTIHVFPQNKYKDCPEEGDNPDIRFTTINKLKNRSTLPGPADFDTSVTTDSMLVRGDDTHRWSEKKAAQLTGQIILVKSGGAESCNCHMESPDDIDTHIEIVSLTKSTKPIIIEITPRLRAYMKTKGIDWSTATLKKLVGSVVIVQGWLLFDEEHKQSADNTAPKGKHNWRATCWELHPVTALKVISK
jgi:hypothetical protein